MARLRPSPSLDLKLKSQEDKEAAIDRLAKTITIASAAGGSSNNLFTISYLDTQPESAKRVVQSLLTIFMEAGIRDSETLERYIGSLMDKAGGRFPNLQLLDRINGLIALLEQTEDQASLAGAA